MNIVLTVVLVVVLALVIVAVVQFAVRPRLGRRGRLGVDAAMGDWGAEFELRRQLSYDVLSRVTPGAFQPGGYLMKGKAAKAMDQLARTFVVRAEPGAVAAVVEPVIRGTGRFSPAAGGLAPGEVAAWEAQSMFGPYPRVSVRASPLLPGVTEFGVTHYQWSLKFPQGGPMVAKIWDPAVQALRTARLVVSEQRRDFQPDPEVRTDVGERDGRWHAEGLVPSGPDLGKTG